MDGISGARGALMDGAQAAASRENEAKVA